MTERERFQKISVPGIEFMTLGVSFGFNPFNSQFLNWGFNTGAKTGVKKSIYQ
ncbi:MAG: hypothetical protein K0M63_07645 [Weeksellaceae bacterium]|nr:hypothetical protein [Weeksellaceae bacterium]